MRATQRTAEGWVRAIAALALLAAAVFPAGAAPLTSVRVYDRAEVASDQILLESIARIDGPDADRVSELKAVVIGRAPLPGKTRVVEQALVLARLKQCGFDPAGLDLQVPPEITVARSSTTIGREQVEEILRAYVRQHGGEGVRIKEIRVTDTLVLPQGPLTTRVLAPKSTEFVGTVPLTVTFKVDGDAERRVNATVSLERLSKVVVARRPLGRFKPIDPEDIEVRAVDAAGLPFDCITDPAAVIGKRTRRLVETGAALRPDMVESPPLVKSGDRVRIVAETEGLRISAFGQVKQRGAQGELIQVMNLDSNKVVYARVLDANTVKIEF
jgi:flagellar basal body P-ring formation protein FlgA